MLWPPVAEIPSLAESGSFRKVIVMPPVAIGAGHETLLHCLGLALHTHSIHFKTWVCTMTPTHSLSGRPHLCNLLLQGNLFIIWCMPKLSAYLFDARMQLIQLRLLHLSLQCQSESNILVSGIWYCNTFDWLPCFFLSFMSLRIQDYGIPLFAVLWTCWRVHHMPGLSASWDLRLSKKKMHGDYCKVILLGFCRKVWQHMTAHCSPRCPPQGILRACMQQQILCHSNERLQHNTNCTVHQDCHILLLYHLTAQHLWSHCPSMRLTFHSAFASWSR